MSARPGQGKVMAVWALTGPVGAGKSVVSRILARSGAAIVDGDRLGHELLGRRDIMTAIEQRIGPEYVVDGAVARDLLAERVFSDPGALVELNHITHGPLGALAARELAGLAAAGEHELAVFEAAVYFLLPSPPPVDLVIAVVAPAELRAERLVLRSGGKLDAAAAALRVAAQAPLTDHWQRADEIIVNDGTLDELEARLLRLVPRPRPGSENLP